MQGTTTGSLSGSPAREQGGHVISETQGEHRRPTFSLTACEAKKLPSFLVYVNGEVRKSRLRVICNTQQRVKAPRCREIFRFWGQRV